jgi:cytochrome c oxidase subunit IV
METPVSNSTTNDHEGGSRLFLVVWAVLLVLTAVEVWLAYEQTFSTGTMLTILMLLSLVKAALIIAYFMHLRFERTTLVLSLIPPVVVVAGLLAVFFPDGVRALELAVR